MDWLTLHKFDPSEVDPRFASRSNPAWFSLPCLDKLTVQATKAAMLASFEESYGARPLFNTQSGKATGGTPHRDWFVPLDQRRRGKRHWKIERV